MPSTHAALSWPEEAPSRGSIVLRTFSEADVHLALELSLDPYVPLVGTLPADAAETEARDWVARQQSRLASGVGYSFAIADIETNRALGFIGLWVSALTYGRASVGYSVAPLDRRQGYASDALIAMTEWAWSIEELHRIEAYVEPWNEASVGVAEKAGYQREGLLREHHEIGGVRKDMLLYAKLRSD